MHICISLITPNGFISHTIPSYVEVYLCLWAYACTVRKLTEFKINIMFHDTLRLIQLLFQPQTARFIVQYVLHLHLQLHCTKVYKFYLEYCTSMKFEYFRIYYKLMIDLVVNFIWIIFCTCITLIGNHFRYTRNNNRSSCKMIIQLSYQSIIYFNKYIYYNS